MNPPTPEDITELRRLLTEADRLAVDADANGYTEGALRPAVRAQRAAEIALRNAAPALLTAADDLAKLYEGVGHPMWLPSVADALEMDEPFQATASDVLDAARGRMERTANTANELTALRLTLEANAAVIAGLRGTVDELRRECDKLRAARAVGMNDAAALIDNDDTFDLTTALMGYINLDAMSPDARAQVIEIGEASIAFAVRAIRAHAALAAGGKA